MGNALESPSRITPAAAMSDLLAGADESSLGLADSALCVLMDFRQHHPITVDIDCCLEEALAKMHRCEAHALLVTHQDSEGVDLQVVGLITRRDIDRRHRLHESVPSGEHDGFVRVGEVMTNWNELTLVRYEALRSIAAVRLHDMFQGTGLTHMLVVEFRDDDSAVARGLLSGYAVANHLNRISTAPKISNSVNERRAS